MSLSIFAAVGAGGAIGAMARYGVAQFAGAGLFGMAGPLATLVVNVTGSAVMGGLAAVLAAGLPLAGGLARLHRRRVSGGAHHLFQLRT